MRQTHLLSNRKERRIKELWRAVDADQRRSSALVYTSSSASSRVVERRLGLVQRWVELAVSVETVRALCVVPESPLCSLVATRVLTGSGHHGNDGGGSLSCSRIVGDGC